MDIAYCCPYWGSEDKPAGIFLDRVLKEGYDGVEINLPDSGEFTTTFMKKIENIRISEKKDFRFIAQQVLPLQKETPDAYLKKMEQRLLYLAALEPDFINAHTGKDYYSFDENCFIIEAAENISEKTGIPIYHELHRGRFTFHSQTTLSYLNPFPEIKFTGDFSHWCTVSESLLQDQWEILEIIIPYIHHIHARIGSEQASQVNNPFAPEWSQHVMVFMSWWHKIITAHKSSKSVFTITPEFGPAPYMPAAPFTQEPLAEQWETNCKMKNLLKLNL